MKKRIGLTGGIGSGKSTVATLFAHHGAAVVDCDAIARELTAPNGEAIAAIRAAFGDHYLDADDALDRVRMRQLIFADTAAKQRLETILHPLIHARIQALAAVKTEAPYILVVVPLLFEQADFRRQVSRALVVDCPESLQIERTMARSGLSEAEVRAIMAQQLTRAERLKRADDVITNTGGMDALKARVARLHQRYQSCAQSAEE